MNIKSRFHLNPTNVWCKLVPWIVFIMTAVVIGSLYVVSHLHVNTILESSGRANVDFRVFYLDNSIWEVNPLPRDLHYLMSYTDYIEVSNSFTADFSETVEIHYTYTATERLVIQHLETSDSNLNPVVFEETWELSEGRGTIIADKIELNISSGPGKHTYTIFPRPHVEQYLTFIEEHEEQAERESILPVRHRGFSAELFTDFTFTVHLPEHGIHETLTYGYHIPLSNEVYTFNVTGTPNFERVDDINRASAQITIPLIIIYVITLGAASFGLYRTIKRLNAEPNEFRREAMSILKKYSNEIVISDPPDLSQYKVMVVEEFESLLRLAINLNKHIMCYHDEEQAQFVTIVHEHAYQHVLCYNPHDNGKSDKLEEEKEEEDEALIYME